MKKTDLDRILAGIATMQKGEEKTLEKIYGKEWKELSIGERLILGKEFRELPEHKKNFTSIKKPNNHQKYTKK